ncbi:VOC family protein [Streptomyces sp. NPDC093085]|uniref:VOC family protein n=1 Tax=Streptomyces sp. NPDC093085 TaxID=3155068 RepID=UPI003420B4DD
MPLITTGQPTGTPTWIDLNVPDVERAMEFYGAVFGWEFTPAGPGGYVQALVRGCRVAGLRPLQGQATGTPRWHVYFATDDCDATLRTATDAGATVLAPAADKGDQGRAAVLADPGGAPFGLWQARTLPGCERVNEPDTLVRNDLTTPDPASAREFYAKVFGFTLDTNPDLPGSEDFTFLRRPDGHEIGGIQGDPEAAEAAWGTLFEVADADRTAERAVAAGGRATTPEDTRYVRLAELTDPFGTVFHIGARPSAAPTS